MLRGYNNDQDLPVKKGTRVSIKKGTPIRHRGQVKPAGKTLEVTCHHTLPGCTVELGVLYPDGKWFWRAGDRILRGYVEQCGLPCANQNELESSIEALKQEAMQNTRKVGSTSEGDVLAADLHLNNPSVVWAGAGGYWSEVDMNLVEIVG